VGIVGCVVGVSFCAAIIANEPIQQLIRIGYWSKGETVERVGLSTGVLLPYFRVME